jgi:predicted nuclease of predicted toxin-antitoxin system
LTERFLIDECLSGALVAVAKAQGYHADYVTHLGKAGWQDWNLVRFAVANDYVIVTNDRKDFLREYAKLDVHAGLVIILPRGDRELQVSLFQKALDIFAVRNDDLVNKLVEVARDGSVHIRDWSAERHDPSHIHDAKRD